jgi:hypothetical protein
MLSQFKVPTETGLNLRLPKVFYFRFFLLGLAIFMIAGISILLFLDKYYLADNSDIQGTLVSSKISKNAKVTLPQDAKNVLYSLDGDYITYMENNKIQVIDLNSGDKKEVVADNNMSISYYKWVGDRDRIILAEKSTNNSYFKLYYYDVVNNNTVEISDGIKQSIIKIPANGKSDAVTDIQLSTFTSRIYIKMTNSSKTTHMYKMNIMASGGSINLPYNNIGTINLLTNDDILLYENLANNRIYFRGKSSPFTITENKEAKKYFKIIGSDNEDVIYLAGYTQGSSKTSTVYYGNDTKGWAVSTLSQQADLKDIFVSSSGEIYVNYVDNNLIFKINDGLQFIYPGKLIGVYTDGIISLQNNQVIRTNFAK